MRHSRYRGNSKCAAFTLIELLVVVAIVGVLIAILVPSLARARAVAREVTCATKLRAWAQAFHNYAVDYGGVLPHSGDETRNPLVFLNKNDPAHPQNESCYLDVLAPYLNVSPWKSFPTGQKPTSGIWQCDQAEVLPDSAYAYSASVWGYHSYAMNQYLDYDIPSAIMPKYPSFLNMAKATNPSVTLLMLETTLDPAQANGQSGIAGACYLGYYSNAAPSSLGDRHPHSPGKLGGNLLMLDGHIEWTDSLWDKSLPRPDNPPTSNRRWWPY